MHGLRFLLLFTFSILSLPQYQKFNRFLTIYFVIFWRLTFLCFLFDLNSIQKIISFLQLQIAETIVTQIQNELTKVENWILSISQLYALFHIRYDLFRIQAHGCFSLLIGHVEHTFNKTIIAIKLDTDISLGSGIAAYYGLTINEAVTNALQHLLETSHDGIVQIILIKRQKQFHLTIEDKEKRFKAFKTYSSLGLLITKTLKSCQSHGTCEISSSRNGTYIPISWEERT